MYLGNCKCHHCTASLPHPYHNHTHMVERMCLFDRYSNTLLVSLNNRISIRDTYGARGGIVSLQAVPCFRNVSRSEVARETTIISRMVTTL